MHSTSVLFDGSRLEMARQLRGLRKVDLAQLIGVTPGAVSQYEAGLAKPRPDTLARIVLALGLPAPFFESGRLHRRCVEDQFHFRRLRTSRKADRSRVLAHTALLAELVAYLEELVELPTVTLGSFEASSSTEVDPEEVAERARSEWKLGQGPISNVVTLLETQGCLVTRLRTSVETVDAFSGWLAGRPFVILSSDKGDTARSRFDAAHELGHLLMHPDPDPANAAHEREAHRFASAFLLPRAQLLEELPVTLNWRLYIDLKFRWRVSLQALLRRAKDLNVLTPDAYRRALAQVSQRGWRRAEPGDLGAPEEPTVLSSALAVVESELAVSRSAFADRLRIPASELGALLTDSTSSSPSLRILRGGAATA